MKFYLTTLAFILSFLTITSQSLPSQWSKDSENHILEAGAKASDGLYDESIMKEIRMYFSQPNYWTLLTQNYTSRTDLQGRIVYEGISYDSVGIRFKGQTSYGGGPGGGSSSSQKKSFNISMDYQKEKQTLEGYKTLNLNNSFSDASFMREVLYYHLIRKHSPAAKANFVHLYINDEDWGVYQNIQQLNKDFLEEWYTTNDGNNFRADRPNGTTGGPGGGANWGDGTAGINYLGQDTNLYQTYYTLKSAGSDDPWTQLKDACDHLNNTAPSARESELPKYFDIDKILWHLACEIAFGDDDSYVFKGKMDYYIYQDEITKRWASYDYDANSTFLAAHTNWSPFYNETKVNYPLLHKLLSVPAFRQRYLAHLRTILAELFDDTYIHDQITKYDAIIRSAVYADPKKATTNTAYDNSLVQLKNFVKDRRSYLLNNAEVKTDAPKVTSLRYYVKDQPFAPIEAGDEVVIRCNINSSQDDYTVSLHHGIGIEGIFTTTAMNDLGIEGDLQAGDGNYAVVLTDLKAGDLVKYYVECIANNTAKTRSYAPSGAEHQMAFFEVNAMVASTKMVVINEFMASNDGDILDEAGEKADWIELYNTSNQSVDLSGYYITDNSENLTKFQLPNPTILAADEYLILWADEDQEQGPFHTNFKLSVGGETIILLDQNGVIQDSVQFGPQTTNLSAARIPNGTGPFLIGDPTFGYNNDASTNVEDEISSDFVFYPNPASEYIYLLCPQTKDVPLEILNIQGQKLDSINIQEQHTVSLSNYPSGIYLLKYGTSVQKCIVTK